jgi:uncharacterized protein YecE (DUF72 family)
MVHIGTSGWQLGPTLLQLPPSLPADRGLFADCLAAFPRSVRLAVEPYHRSWWTEEIEGLLAQHDAALC